MQWTQHPIVSNNVQLLTGDNKELLLKSADIIISPDESKQQTHFSISETTTSI